MTRGRWYAILALLVRSSWAMRVSTHHVQRPVGLAVAAPVEAVPHRLARAGRHRRRPGQHAEGTIAAQAGGLSPALTRKRAGATDPDARTRHQLWRGASRRPTQLAVARGDLGAQYGVASGQTAQRHARAADGSSIIVGSRKRGTHAAPA